MAKKEVQPITFTYDGTDYALYFTRASIKEMEKGEGFDISKMQEKLTTNVEKLWFGSFLAKHRRTSEAKKREIWNLITDKSKLIERLAELYSAPVEALLDEPAKDEKNAIKWN